MSAAGSTPIAQDLAGQVVLVTGGSRGIGRAAALECAARGARVALSARKPDEVAAICREIEARTGRATLGIVGDVSVKPQVDAMLADTESKLGPIDGLICAAGIYGPIGAFDAVSFDEWEKALTINLTATAYCIHRVLPAMKRRQSGRIVLFSGGGQGPLAHFSSYVTSKGGIWRLTETLASELRDHGVTINAIAPGAVNTVFLEQLLAAGPERVGRDFYEKSLKQKQDGGTPPERAAELCAWLLSPAARGLSGKVLSAVWDKYREFPAPGFDSMEAMSRSDLFTAKRVVEKDGRTR